MKREEGERNHKNSMSKSTLRSLLVANTLAACTSVKSNLPIFSEEECVFCLCCTAIMARNGSSVHAAGGFMRVHGDCLLMPLVKKDCAFCINII